MIKEDNKVYLIDEDTTSLWIVFTNAFNNIFNPNTIQSQTSIKFAQSYFRTKINIKN